VKPVHNGTSMDWIISFAVRVILIEAKVKVKVKVKFTLEQTTKVQMGSRGIALFFNFGTR